MWLRTVTVISLLLGCHAFFNNETQHRPFAKHDFPTPGMNTIMEQMHRRSSSALNFHCVGCLDDDGNGNPVVLRALFVEANDMVENSVAMEAAERAGTNYDCGSCCADPQRAHPECFVAENWNGGWIAKPVLRILATTGAKIVAMTPANLTAEAASLTYEGHPYALCPLDVLLGNVDLCVGDWWETLARRTRVKFSTPLDVNHFKLITLAKKQEGFKPKTFLEMFQPFSAEVWVAMLGMFTFAGFAFWMLNEYCEDFDETEVFPHPKGFVKGLWVAAMGYFAGNQFEVMSWPGRIVLLGYSFFLATAIAAYTANLASFMVQQQEDFGLVTSLNDIVMRGKTLCLVPEVSNMITEPGIMERVVVLPGASMGSMFEMLDMGLCDASLVGKAEYLLYAQAGNVQYDICTTESDPNYGGGFYCVKPDSDLTRFDLTKCQCGTDPPLDVAAEDCPVDCVAPYSKFCNVVEVLDPTLRVSLNYALPTTNWFEPMISAGILHSKLTGDFYKDFKMELTDNNPPKCPLDSPQQTFTEQLKSENQAQSLSVHQMAGTFLIAAVFMFSGLLLRCWHLLRQRGDAKIEDDQHATFLREKSQQRSDWEMSAGLKLKSASPDCSLHNPSQIVSIAPPPESDLEVVPVGESLADDSVTVLQNHEAAPVGEVAAAEGARAGEASSENPAEGAGWGEMASVLEEAQRGMALRQGKFVAIKEIALRLRQEVKHVRSRGVVVTADAKSFKTTSGGAGSSFRKRQGR